jgi:tetratricopeptide (TPR) repeat protein
MRRTTSVQGKRMAYGAVNLHVALLVVLVGSSPGAAAPLRASQTPSKEVSVGRQVVFYQPPVTADGARRVAELLEKTSRDPEERPAQFRRSRGGYSLWLAFPGETWRDPESVPSASWAGRLVSAAILDGAALTVHVSDATLESKKSLAIELEPGDVPFYRGEALTLLKRTAEAIDQFRTAVELRPKDTRFLLRYGEALYSDWQDADAEREYRAALELEPGNARAHFLLGELKFQQGQLTAALPLFRRAVELEPDFARAHEMLGSTYDLLGRYDEAIQRYKRAIEIAPSANRYNELGITYRNKKQLDDAIARFRAGIELYPEDALLHRNLATTLVMAGRGDQSGKVFARAIELYRRAAESEPDRPELHASLGFMLAQVQDFEGAVASFRRALALDPRAPLTCGGLGDAYLKMKRFDEAVDAFRKMVELQPEDGFALHRLAQALETAGRFDEAEAAFERARQLGYPRQ